MLGKVIEMLIKLTKKFINNRVESFYEVIRRLNYQITSYGRFEFINSELYFIQIPSIGFGPCDDDDKLEKQIRIKDCHKELTTDCDEIKCSLDSGVFIDIPDEFKG